MPFVDGLKETELVIDMAKKHGHSGVHPYQHWTYFRDKANGAYCPKQGKPKKLIDIYREVRRISATFPYSREPNGLTACGEGSTP